MNDLSTLAKRHKVFVDTCSWMHQSSAVLFSDEAKQALKDKNATVIVPASVLKELNYLQEKEERDVRERAQRAALLLKTWIAARVIDVRGEDSDPFADHLFLNIFSRFRTKYSLVLITQDEQLARDVSGLNDQQSVQSRHSVNVLRLTKNGRIGAWRFGETPEKKETRASAERPPLRFSHSDNRSPRPFDIDCALIAEGNRLLDVRSIAGKGDKIVSSCFGTLELKEQIGGGGEGLVFATDRPELVCKIYARHRLTATRRDKLSLMLTHTVEIPGVCWPRDLVNNALGQFVGYVMPRAQGLPMQRCLFVKPLLLACFPAWTRRELIHVALAILDRIAQLQGLGVLIGDINPHNILIADSRRIFFVDTDSFQVEGYPCAVGTANFTAAEIQGQNFAGFLRTVEHENFAVATLLFMILHPGKPPYSHQGGGDPSENIRTGCFSYRLGEQFSGKVPEGPWRYIWSNLPYRIKEAFHRCFTTGERPTVRQWIDLMSHYLHALESGYVSDELFPTSLKKVSEHTAQKFGVEIRNFVHFTCEGCGKDFDLTEENAKIKEVQNRPLCPLCAGEETRQREQHDREHGTELICSACSSRFLFSISDARFFQQKGLNTPKRCPDCRKQRKAESAW